MKFAILLTVAVAAVGLSGCASIMKGSTQNIAITSPPATGAHCTLTNPRGSWTVVTPGTVEVKRSKANIEIVCRREGFQDATAFIPSGFQNWTTGNLLIGGVIGLGIDSATGATNDYPAAFAVPMTQLPVPSLTAAPAPAEAPATAVPTAPAPAATPAAPAAPAAPTGH
jgi:hypothetical protein